MHFPNLADILVKTNTWLNMYLQFHETYPPNVLVLHVKVFEIAVNIFNQIRTQCRL